MQKIIPHLWYDKEAKEAAEFYVSVFGGDSKITNVSVIRDTPSGDCDIVSFELLGHSFMAISAGPLFKFNPSVSFSVSYKTKEEVDRVWAKLVVGGKVLMELDKYPFSERYGWLQDRYGLSWQIISLGGAEVKQTIIPSLMFVGKVYGKAEEAMNFYASIFKNSETGDIFRYTKDQQPDKEGAVAHGVFTLDGQMFIAMDSAGQHDFTFSEAISFMVNCKDQKEIDYFWDKLTAVPEAEQCGWLKDKYGLSWQVVPVDLGKLLNTGDEQKTARVTQAFLKMKKFDLAELKRAAENN